MWSICKNLWIYDCYNKFFFTPSSTFLSFTSTDYINLQSTSSRKEKREKGRPFSLFFYDLPVHPLTQPDFLFISNDGGVGQSNK